MSQSIDQKYAVTQHPTPVFNRPDFAACFGGDDGDTLSLDGQGLMRSVETVLFPQSKVELLQRVAQSSIWQIRSDEYKSDDPCYIDSRFIEFSDGIPPNRAFELPPPSKIVAEMENLVGTGYIWGGNWPEGIGLLPQLYPSKTPLNKLGPLIQNTWKLKGVDCSGLIHYATRGWTPRNSSALVNFCDPVLIEGLKIEAILSKLQLLDLIVWRGHVVCVFDQKTSIESKLGEGVVKRDLSERLSQIMRERKPVNDWTTSEGSRFVIRRWHPQR
jgi:hypothetical protein